MLRDAALLLLMASSIRAILRCRHSLMVTPAATLFCWRYAMLRMPPLLYFSFSADTCFDSATSFLPYGAIRPLFRCRRLMFGFDYAAAYFAAMPITLLCRHAAD